MVGIAVCDLLRGNSPREWAAIETEAELANKEEWGVVIGLR
jgi:hypothetical protein